MAPARGVPRLPPTLMPGERWPTGPAGKRNRDRAPGFTLIEALAALLVLSVGLLGIAALHGQGLAASRSAIYRSQAIVLAGDIAERIRANPRAPAAYAGDAADLPCSLPSRAGGVACSPEQMAAHDLFVWHSHLLSALPGGNGRIAVDAARTPPRYTISISWSDPASPASLAFEIDVARPGDGP